jgi:hypothetical protein
MYKVREDNIGTILLLEKGYSPAMRHLPKTHKCSVDYLHEIFHVLKAALIKHIDTKEQLGDPFTKGIEPRDWPNALRLLQIGVSLRNKSLIKIGT